MCFSHCIIYMYFLISGSSESQCVFIKVIFQYTFLLGCLPMHLYRYNFFISAQIIKKKLNKKS